MATIIALSTIGSIIGLALAKRLTYKTFDRIKYKIQKKKVYKNLKKYEKMCDHGKYITQIDKLKSFDAHYNKNKYNKYKRKRNLNDTVIQDPELYRMFFNADYLLEVNQSRMNSSHSGDSDLEERMARVEESLRLTDNEDRLNFYPLKEAE